jgi:hypothetical protein
LDGRWSFLHDRTGKTSRGYTESEDYSGSRGSPVRLLEDTLNRRTTRVVEAIGAKLTIGLWSGWDGAPIEQLVRGSRG